jgi:hypothetical protein
MLRELVEANNERCFYRPKVPGNSQTSATKLLPMIDQVASWRFDKWTEVDGEGKGKLIYNECKASILFKDGTKGILHLDESNFYRLDVLGQRYKQTYFKLLKTGKLAYIAEEELWGMTDYELIMDGIQEHQTDGMRLHEGDAVLVLQTLVLGDIPLVKFLHGEEIRWTYGVLFDKDYFDDHDNDNHWL